VVNFLDENEDEKKEKQTKEQKLNSGVEKINKKSKMTSNSQENDITDQENAGETVKASSNTPRAYNNMILKKFESDLEKIMNSLTEKASKKEKLKEDDQNIEKLIQLIAEFDKNNFNGSEFINSQIGKLFKTIQYILVHNKDMLNKKVLIKRKPSLFNRGMTC